MRNIWNPWHGCKKKSEGCLNCYVYYFDKKNNKETSKIYKVKTNFNYPLSKYRDGSYKLTSGMAVVTCITSDFFLKEADEWRNEAWNIIKKRKDLMFYIITKRPERIKECLPSDWNDGWENVYINITAENQKRLDERAPILISLPIKHKGIILAPLLEKVSAQKYLEYVDKVSMDGENYDGARPFDLEWAKLIRKECIRHNVTFELMGVGQVFVYNGVMHNIKREYTGRTAKRFRLDYIGKEIIFNLESYEQLTLF